jgi:hypothetical protein
MHAKTHAAVVMRLIAVVVAHQQGGIGKVITTELELSHCNTAACNHSTAACDHSTAACNHSQNDEHNTNSAIFFEPRSTTVLRIVAAIPVKYNF